METKAAVSRLIELRGRLEALAPKCRQCGGSMIRRSMMSAYFWACQGFPKECAGTAGFSDEAKLISAEIERIEKTLL
jgi:hypothetical protein